jgi:hypothetical protein
LSRRPPQPEWSKWLRANGHDLAGLTGADWATLAAIDACWQSLGYVDSREAVLTAVRALLPNMQSQFHPFARELIARALDWGDRSRIWAQMEAAPIIDPKLLHQEVLR